MDATDATGSPRRAVRMTDPQGTARTVSQSRTIATASCDAALPRLLQGALVTASNGPTRHSLSGPTAGSCSGTPAWMCPARASQSRLVSACRDLPSTRSLRNPVPRTELELRTAWAATGNSYSIDGCWLEIGPQPGCIRAAELPAQGVSPPPRTARCSIMAGTPGTGGTRFTIQFARRSS